MKATKLNETEKQDLKAKLAGMSINEIATIILANWKNVNFGAVPYLNAMRSLAKITDNYLADSGVSIVTYFLSNAQTWRGDVARLVKVELLARIKAAS